MKLIIGLGNPGREYENTRHNAGFMFVDALQKKCELSEFSFDKKFHAEISNGTCPDGTKMILVKPQEFMNRSGSAVYAICEYYKVPFTDIIVVHDDLDIEIGNYKKSHNIRAAGHNGVQDIIEKTGTQEFTRIRIGIEMIGGKKEREKIPGNRFVLQRFSENELHTVTDVISTILKDF